MATSQHTLNESKITSTLENKKCTDDDEIMVTETDIHDLLLAAHSDDGHTVDVNSMDKAIGQADDVTTSVGELSNETI